MFNRMHKLYHCDVTIYDLIRCLSTNEDNETTNLQFVLEPFSRDIGTTQSSMKKFGQLLKYPRR